MEDKLFDTEEKKEAAILAYRGLLNDPGWKFHTQVLQAQIDVLTEQILKGGIPEVELDAFRKKLEAYQEAIDNPQTQIDRLQPPTSEQPSPDPYQTKEQLKAERKKA